MSIPCLGVLEGVALVVSAKEMGLRDLSQSPLPSFLS